MKKTGGMSIKALLMASLINNFAFGFIWPIITVYLNGPLHQTLITAGWVMLMVAFGQAFGSILSGRLFDRFEPYHLMLYGTLAMIGIQIVLIFVHGWPFYVINLMIASFLNGWIMAIINAYGTLVRSHDGRYVFNMLYFTNNFGMVFATALMGLIYPHGITWLFIGSLVLYLLLLVNVRFNFNIEASFQTVKDAMGVNKLPVWNKRIVFGVILGLIVLWIAYAQWQGNLSVYMTDNLHLPLWQYSLLWTINGLLIAVIQLIINKFNLGSGSKAMWIQIFGGILMFGCAFLILPFAKNFTGFAFAMIVTTLGEVTAFPMIPALVNELTPANLKGRYQGLVSAAPSIGRAIGPLLGGMMIEQFNYKILFDSGAGLVFVTFAILVYLISKGYRHTQQFTEGD
ncbi:MFS family permease [Weissella uvarum]|uniref:MDR family MFS transporter n=1 Tax=Weissella uvarum TaxID=1479233 RepID=UPI0019616153|nr:MFS transporter [Weissella uvarum]MBM7617687.1 MFS family permease [Weissella uvarum]MCM0596036.1 MFS transporter [Weissella uvarum]